VSADACRPGPPATRLKKTLLLLGTFVMVSGAALLWMTEGHLQRYLLRSFTAHTGRPVRVDGEFQLHLLSRHPHLTATRVTIDNPPWMPAGVTAEVGRLALLLQWQFSTRPLQIRRLELEQAKFHLVRAADGRANWLASENGAGSGPPLIRSLTFGFDRMFQTHAATAAGRLIASSGGRSWSCGPAACGGSRSNVSATTPRTSSTSTMTTS